LISQVGRLVRGPSILSDEWAGLMIYDDAKISNTKLRDIQHIKIQYMHVDR